MSTCAAGGINGQELSAVLMGALARDMGRPFNERNTLYRRD
jgi:hypothetical protein